MKLNYYRGSWPLQLEYAPCDLHFVEYLEARKIAGKSIFHFGTGEHHLVGRSNYERGNPNEVFGITASKEEHDAYIDFIIGAPAASNFYRVVFGDIYTLSARMLPAFDIVTLFHLGEYYDDCPAGTPELNSEYARLNDATMLELFLSKLNPGGKIIFFTGSGGLISRREPGLKVISTKMGAMLEGDRHGVDVINGFLSSGRMTIEEQYESLLICAGPASAKL